MSYTGQTAGTTAGIKKENVNRAFNELKQGLYEYRYDFADGEYGRLMSSTSLGDFLVKIGVTGKVTKQGNFTNLSYDGFYLDGGYEAFIYMLQKCGHGKIKILAEDATVYVYDFNKHTQKSYHV